LRTQFKKIGGTIYIPNKQIRNNQVKLIICVMTDENHLSVKCQNCGQVFEGRYCPHCGVDSESGPLNLKNFVKETVNSLDIDRGFFKTCIILLIKPGLAIRKYLNENRHSLYNPVKLVLIIGAVVSLVVFRFDTFAPSRNNPFYLALNLEDFDGYVYYSAKYFSFFQITSIPLFTLASWLFFKGSQYNFTQNLILNLYIAGGQFVINLLYALISVLFTYENMGIIAIANIGYNVWVLTTFFPGKIIPNTLKSLFAVAIPQVGMFFINYLIYRAAPVGFWEMLDLM